MSSGSSGSSDSSGPRASRPGWAYVVAVALITGWFAARWRAAWYAYPFAGFQDEPYLVDFAHAMVRDGDWNPHFFNYPSLAFDLLAGLFALGDWSGALPVGDAGPSPDHYVWTRLLVLALGALSLPLTAELGRRLVSPLAGVAAAAFLAVTPLFTSFSYLATVNPPLACTAALAGLGAARVFERGTRVDHLRAGIAAGLALGTKYVAFPAALLAPLAHLLGSARRQSAGWRASLAALSWFAAAAVLVFFLTSPFIVLDFGGFWKDLHRTGDVYDYEENWHFHEAEGATSYTLIAARFFDRSFREGPTLCALFGLAWLARRRWRTALLLALVPLATWAFLGAYKVYFPRNLMGALPFVCVLSGAGIAGVHELGGRALASLAARSGTSAVRWLSAVATAAIAAWALAEPLSESRAEIRSDLLIDTRRAALEWIDEHVPRGARLLREERTPPIEELLLGYEVRYTRSLARPDRLSTAEEFDYVLLTVPFRRDVRLVDEYAVDRALYAEFMRRHRLVAEFDEARGGLTGRRIAIYAIGGDPP